LVFFGSISSQNLGYRAWDCVCLGAVFILYNFGCVWYLCR